MHGILYIIIKQRYTYWDDLEGREDVLVHNSFCRVQNQRKFARSCMICCLCDPIRLMFHLILIAKFMSCRLGYMEIQKMHLCGSLLTLTLSYVIPCSSSWHKGMIASWSIFSGFYHRFYARTLWFIYHFKQAYTLIPVIIIPQWESCWEFEHLKETLYIFSSLQE